ncbi:MAG: zinc-binding alcohol dehydrogenase [Burkholderiales bacterium]|nr:zinc-binding alcohol dehydrogenase [Burkholderiales bacterium]
MRALFSGVSRGTETLVYRGEVPEAEYGRMRAPFQAGAFPAPVKYGYASVGVVEEGPDALAGRAVFCLHPHQTRYVVPAAAVRPIPDAVPPARAVLAANMETAVNALWDANLRAGDRVAVVGAGALGCLVARLVARTPGCDVELVDVNPRRAELARVLGARFALPASARGDADLVVHASGAPEGARVALELAGFEATVLELSWYGTREVALPLGGRFHAQRLALKSSQVGNVAAAQRARWTRERRLDLALALLDDPALDALVTGEDRFADLPQAMARLATAAGDTLCHRIRYG